MTTPHPPQPPYFPEPIDSAASEHGQAAPSYGPPPPGYGTPPPGYGPPPAAQPRHAAPALASDPPFPSRSDQPGPRPSQTPFTPPTGQPWAPQPQGGYAAAGASGTYANPGASGPYAPAAGPSGYPLPGQPVKKGGSLKTRIAVAAVGLLVVGGLLLFGYLNGRDDVVNAAVGDCVNVVSETDFETVDCSTPEAQYKVLSVFEGLSAGAACQTDPDYDSHISITGDVTKTLCLQTWLQVGDCVGGDGSWTDCGATETAYEVVEVLVGTQDDAACPDTAVFSRIYQGEDNVVCLAEKT